ncbi:ABC transporter ATP-binding protein [Candidatus Protochlamydia phocaeensis]|uniref:ABC transporter ATP-binding protein n=1 Tax=Candidatus Protochlamydia phocaeensis TaxID=1414722 RepID=UPI0008397DA0|nr:ABC transporter ATP-binding protein [Candidatus Protochlamydia phocaeensis]
MKKDFHQRYIQDEVKSKSIDYAIIKRLLAYLRPYRLLVILAVILLLVSKAIEAWVPLEIGWIVQTILSHSASADSHELFHHVVRSCSIVFGWILVGFILDTANVFIKNWVGQEALLALRLQVYQHIQRLPMAFYDHHAVGRLMTRTIHDVDQISQLFSESVIPILGSLFLFISILIGIFILNWKIGLAILFIMPAVWWVTHDFRYHQRQSYQIVRSILSAMNAFIQEHLMGIGIIRSFNLYKQEREKFDELNWDYFKANIETIHHFALFFAGIEWIQNFTMAAVFVILVQFAMPGSGFQAGTYFTISLYSLMVFRPLADLAERYNVLQSALAAAERIFEVLDVPVEPEGPHPGLPLNDIQTIVFDNVWFAYEKENWILRGLSLSIRRGESAALVGMTGSGKTSVLNLLLRLYEFQKGHIWINGKDIRDYSVADLRRQFSVILQDPVIFSGTIADNIALYDSSLKLNQIKASADFVNLSPFIEHLPGQFDYLLKERGISLSVGEMQLISLARAVAHHRSVIIFDEATSNIDLQTEKAIQETLKKMLANQTALVIAHRLSTIRDVDRIFVLSDGIVIEQGSHQDLIEKQGIYEKLYRLQFSNSI